MASALPPNVTLLEDTPVQAIDLTNKTIQTPKARLSADTIVLATNAFTEKFGVTPNKVTPIFTYASLTRPLNNREMQSFQNNAAANNASKNIALWGFEWFCWLGLLLERAYVLTT